MARMTVVLVVACFVAWLPARHEAPLSGARLRRWTRRGKPAAGAPGWPR